MSTSACGWPSSGCAWLAAREHEAVPYIFWPLVPQGWLQNEKDRFQTTSACGDNAWAGVWTMSRAEWALLRLRLPTLSRGVEFPIRRFPSMAFLGLPSRIPTSIFTLRSFVQ
ncbi:hypothetical protein FIBSPDRAFT_970130 [Athelia psychrophila]|uniref:Uncharacterized protein n=1 Tax=Athelia psychrophila TaxID=1759441 RepID=A0A167SWW7_9AGAM|nr:hypothetical protein FIBSPDRAFT_970130 [Fibularhizoctonia sp. CBS 109695]